MNQVLPDLPLDFFDKARENEVENAGFMPGEHLPIQKAHVRFEQGDIRISNTKCADGAPNVGLNFRIRVLQGERSKGGSFWWTFWLRAKDGNEEKQNTIGYMLRGMAKRVGLDLPVNTKAETLKAYSKTFEGRDLIGGIGQDAETEDGKRVVTGNRLTGFEKATPEAIAKIKALYERRKTGGASAKTPSPFKIGS